MLIKENTKVTISLVLLVTLIIGITATSFKFGTQLERFDNRIFRVEMRAAEHDEIDHRLNAQDIALVEIQTDLKWIRQRMEEEAR